MRGKYPERIVEKAVERMLPRGPPRPAPAFQSARLSRRRASHEAQQPEALDIGAMNDKNHNYSPARSTRKTTTKAA